MKPEFDYSLEWKPYLGYDKFEYDIQLKNGIVIENCYPNAGFFRSFTTGDRINEEEVELIRYSTEPICELNYNLGSVVGDDYIEKLKRNVEARTAAYTEEKEKQAKQFGKHLEKIYTPSYSGLTKRQKADLDKIKPVGKRNPIERNGPCPCGSGKKYKKCCLTQ